MSVSGVAPPTTVRGWEPIFVDDFDVDVPRGKFVSNPAYASRWSAFHTGWRTSSPWKAGWYDNSILEVANSCLIINVHTEAGHPLVAALRPKLSATPLWGVKALRRTIRFKADVLPGYKVAWLLWPDAKTPEGKTTWPLDGEIDFPECDLDGVDTIKGFMHHQGATKGSDQSRGVSPVIACDGNWHTATINWKSGGWRTPVCEFILDGERVGKWFTRVPIGPMHEVIQTEPKLQWKKPDPSVAGRILIDWYAAYGAA